jgi:thiamine-monophosphate kinase
MFAHATVLAAGAGSSRTVGVQATSGTLAERIRNPVTTVFHTDSGYRGVMSSSWSQSPTVSELGEQAVLDRILSLLTVGHGVQVGPGDDAAVVSWPSDHLVTTMDLMIEGPDFRLDWSTGFDVGWKAMASNLADVAAMGAVSRGVIIGLALPDTIGMSAVEDIARGVTAGLTHMAPGCGVWGGDLSSASQVMISVTVVGDLEGRAPVTRSGATAGDLVAHAGPLGLSSRGLSELLEKGSDPVSLRETSDAVAWHLRPTPPLHLGPVAALAGATALMDVSDGLLIDARRMAVASGVVIDLDGGVIPDHHSLTGGEDHGLLACFPPDSSVPDGFAVVGRVIAGAGQPGVVTVDGVVPADGQGGWDPYRRTTR